MSFTDLLDKAKFNIWRYEGFYPPIEPRFRLSLGEGWTGEQEIEGILFKKELDNPTGSLKDRGMAYQMSDVYRLGLKEVVIPSSGNAAISASAYASSLGIRVTAYVSPQINPGKLAVLQAKGAEVRFSMRPIEEAEAASEEFGLRNLRPSRDEAAVPGFMSLGLEIYERLIRRGRPVGAIFLPVSSGTALVGLGRALQELHADGFIKTFPQLHLVQTAAVCPLASVCDSDFRPKARSVAKAICAKETARQTEVMALVQETRGSGWVVDDTAIGQAEKWLAERGLVVCPTSAAALAGLWKAKEKGREVKAPLVILTGRTYDR